ncbi:MAG: hypothetical protein R2704_17730 [Microthrixaceae bacterium]
MALGADLDAPTMLVLDLDPGPDVDLSGCCEVALWLREILESVDLVGSCQDVGFKGHAAVRAAEHAARLRPHLQLRPGQGAAAGQA